MQLPNRRLRFAQSRKVPQSRKRRPDSHICVHRYRHLSSQLNLQQTIESKRRTLSTAMSTINLNGIFPPVTTPFNARGDVDYAALTSNIARYNEDGLVGYVALGSNGEVVHLSMEERMRVIETIKRGANKDHTIIAGVNELSTRAAMEA